jgi:hypothetical protein
MRAIKKKFQDVIDFFISLRLDDGISIVITSMLN